MKRRLTIERTNQPVRATHMNNGDIVTGPLGAVLQIIAKNMRPGSGGINGTCADEWRIIAITVDEL